MDYSYASTLVANYWALEVFPQDPENFWDYLVTGGNTLGPHCVTYVNNIAMINNAQSGFRRFRYSKVKVKVTVENTTGSGQIEGTSSPSNAGNRHWDMVVATAPKPWNGVDMAIPTDTAWVMNKYWKYMTVKQPLQNQEGTSKLMIKAYSKGEKKTMTRTFRPWLIERVPKKTYMMEDDYETLLSGIAGNQSTITKPHSIQIMGFNPWYLDTPLGNGTYQCKINLTVTIYGYYYDPRANTY